MIIIFSGPSGVGKSTIINNLSNDFNFYFSTSHTTRPQRESEIEGKDYYFISEDEFNSMITNDEFLEYERYGSYYYGTSKKELERDDFIVLDLEVNGATKLLASNDSYIGIFIDIDDNVLIERLNERGHDDQFIQERMNLAKEQRQSMANFDYIIKNIDLKATIKEILDILYDLEKK